MDNKIGTVVDFKCFFFYSLPYQGPNMLKDD